MHPIQRLKHQTGLALAEALRALGENFSEHDLATAWLAALRRHSGMYEDGWYDPPPHGVIALFGDKGDKYSRINQPSFRPPALWPRADLRCDGETIIAAYASPVQRETSLIGDFGLSLYRGSDPAIRDHFERVLATTLAIAAAAEVGMELRELYRIGLAMGAKEGFVNNIDSTTDQTGTNIGHTIPLSYASDATHFAISRAETFPQRRDALRTGRKFLNAEESQPIEADFAFTVEPRFSSAPLPNTWFHLTVVFSRGQRRIFHGFGPVFATTGMERLIRLLPSAE